MASNKQKQNQNQKASQASAKKEEEKNKRVMLIALIVLLLLFLLGWWMAANHWGPWSTDKDATNQGTEANKNGGSSTDQNSGSGTSGGGSTSNGSGTGAAGANGSNGSNGSSGTNGTNGSNGTTPTTPTTPPATNTDAIISLSGSVANGQTKDDVTAHAGGTNQTCTITANSTAAGKQEVCTYSQGSKVVTVTYLNDRVVNVNRSGL
jgi:cytoskeletal protein RodZ